MAQLHGVNNIVCFICNDIIVSVVETKKSSLTLSFLPPVQVDLKP
jgi:hypothetical protein